jgi:prepilin-type N-terminal cleavage/methylation domain-containing protein
MNTFQLKTNRPHADHAFSLVEMVIAISIVAILASVSVFSFSNIFNSTQLDNTAKRLVADLKLTRQQAIQDQNTSSFMISPSSRHYQAPGVKNLVGTDSIYLDLEDDLYKSTTISLSLNEEGNNTIQFDPAGQVANFGTILLTNGDQEKTITITAEGEINATE